MSSVSENRQNQGVCTFYCIVIFYFIICLVYSSSFLCIHIFNSFVLIITCELLLVSFVFLYLIVWQLKIRSYGDYSNFFLNLNCRKRRSYNTPEVREESTSHVTTKQSALHASMQEEPINKKLMELAEGKCRKSREKSAESYKNKPSTPALSKDKSDSKEMIPPEAKRPCLEEPLPSIHTESDDLSDISDDPDDILNMDDEVPKFFLNFHSNKKVIQI